MDIEQAVDTLGFVENAGGSHYLIFPYTSEIGIDVEKLSIRVPIHGDSASGKDKQALAEAVAVQGALGQWVLRDDGAAHLVSRT